MRLQILRVGIPFVCLRYEDIFLTSFYLFFNSVSFQIDDGL